MALPATQLDGMRAARRPAKPVAKCTTEREREERAGEKRKARREREREMEQNARRHVDGAVHAARGSK